MDFITVLLFTMCFKESYIILLLLNYQRTQRYIYQYIMYDDTVEENREVCLDQKKNAPENLIDLFRLLQHDQADCAHRTINLYANIDMKKY